MNFKYVLKFYVFMVIKKVMKFNLFIGIWGRKLGCKYK